MKNPLAIFKTLEAPQPETKGGGMAIIRARVRAHVRYPEAHAILARETGTGSEAVHAFVCGADNLSDAQIANVLDHLDMRAAYDRKADLLRSTAPEPTSMGRHPDSYVHVGPPVDTTTHLYPRDPSAESKPAWPAKPGWA